MIQKGETMGVAQAIRKVAYILMRKRRNLVQYVLLSTFSYLMIRMVFRGAGDPLLNVDTDAAMDIHTKSSYFRDSVPQTINETYVFKVAEKGEILPQISGFTYKLKPAWFPVDILCKDVPAGSRARRALTTGYHRIPYNPHFNPDQVRMLIILSYQRCGSSFFGQLLATNPDVFYMYEPLDSLYSALYGTTQGWNVPADITTFSNGSARKIPEREMQAVSILLHHLLTCKVDSLPTETLAQRFFYMFQGEHRALQTYTKCISYYNVIISKCEPHIRKHCGGRFGEVGPSRQEECNKYLWNKKFRESSPHPVSHAFVDYKKCTDKLRGTINMKCKDYFLEGCKSKYVHSIKTVRATMTSMEPLLKEFPNLRVIHLVRDPRAVVSSRRAFHGSGQGSFSQGVDFEAHEASAYCRTVVKDLQVRKRLEREYPGRIYPIIYDDLVKDPVTYTENIYKFINASLHENTLSWVIKNTYQYRKSANIATKWQKKNMTFKAYRDIMLNCKEFFRQIPYDWPTAEESLVNGFSI